MLNSTVTISKTPLSTAWVKNVYSLWVTGGVVCGYIYTGILTTLRLPTTMVVKPQPYTHLTTSFTPSLFTAFFRHFNLLITHLYTLSTVPTIKTKEIN